MEDQEMKAGVNLTKLLALTPVMSAILVAGLVPSATAQEDPAGMSCNALLTERNSIYACNGYCFKTERARAVFGPGCFPPYGKLSGWEQSRVNELQMWEQRKGC
jgi:YARHG domain